MSAQTSEPTRRQVQAAMTAAALLVRAYEAGKLAGGSVEWSDVDDAHEAARRALGRVQVAAIRQRARDFQDS